MEFEFNVGGTKKHVVRFQYSRLINTVKIYIDDEMVKRDVFRIMIPPLRRYEFQVGENEPHDVLIETRFPRVGAKFANPKCAVTVDGKFVSET